jgi:purine-binding chemotaxis protein CheW
MRFEDTGHILLFAVGEMKHALSLSGVERVELAAEVTPLPEAPHIVIGAINVRGQILPVLSMRRRLHLPERSVRASDWIIIVQSSRRRIALVVDEVMGVRPAEPSDFTSADALSEGLGCVAGAVRTAEGIVLIHDLELFLSEADEKALEQL